MRQQQKLDDNAETMSQEQFFIWHEQQERRHELINGVPVMQPKMQTGTTRKHDRVTMNALGNLFNQLKGKPCQANTADVAIQIPVGNIRYPDVSIDCGQWDAESRTADNPVLVIEVLSPSTMRMDTIHKVEEYKTVLGLQAIILVSTIAPEITFYTRSLAQSQDKTAWEMRIFREEKDVLEFSDIDVKLPLSTLYEGMTFSNET